MIKIISIVLAIVLTLTIIMFILLKRIVNTINEQAKVFFMMKLQSYDELIEKKEEELKKLNEQTVVPSASETTVNAVKEKVNVVIQDDVPKYELEGLLEVIKKIDDEFNFDFTKVIQQFVNYSCNFNADYYNKLLAIKEKIINYGLYNIVIKSELEQLEILKNLNINDSSLFEIYNFSYKKFNINNFLKILDIEIKKNDPIIYVYVGKKSENFDNLGENVHTQLDNTILKGIKVKYRNVMYEYSLSY